MATKDTKARPRAEEDYGDDYWREQDEMAREMEEYLWRNSRRW